MAGWLALVVGFCLVLNGFILGWIDGSLGYDHFILLGLAVEMVAVGLLVGSGRI